MKITSEMVERAAREIESGLSDIPDAPEDDDEVKRNDLFFKEFARRVLEAAIGNGSSREPSRETKRTGLTRRALV